MTTPTDSTPRPIALTRLTAASGFDITVSQSASSTGPLTLSQLREFVASAVICIALPRGRTISVAVRELEFVQRTATGYRLPNATAVMGDQSVPAVLDLE